MTIERTPRLTEVLGAFVLDLIDDMERADAMCAESGFMSEPEVSVLFTLKGTTLRLSLVRGTVE